MALIHANPGQIIDLQPYAETLPQAVSQALFKGAQLEVLRMVLHAGKSIPQHHMAEEVTIQCIEGWIELTTAAASLPLRPGQLVWLGENTPYAMLAKEDSSLLLTIALARPAA